MKLFIIDEEDTLYAIKAYLPEDALITVGKLGTFTFRRGVCVYVGSAKRNIQARIKRHLKIDKRFHWHFDYLRPLVTIVLVRTFSGEEGECQLFQRLMDEVNGTIPVYGFGASDCRCPAHLFFTE